MNTTAPPTQPGPLPVRAKVSGLAITSLVLGVLGFCTGGLAGIVGLILGIIAIIAISKSEGRKSGTGIAIAGVTSSACSFVMVFLLIGLLLPSLTRAREAARGMLATTNIRQVAMHAMMYSENNNDLLPPADDWVNILSNDVSFSSDLLAWPGQEQDGRCFAMNNNLDGWEISTIQNPAQTVLFYEVPLGSPLAGGSELIGEEGHFGQGFIISFVDGSADRFVRDELDSLIWLPE